MDRKRVSCPEGDEVRSGSGDERPSAKLNDIDPAPPPTPRPSPGPNRQDTKLLDFSLWIAVRHQRTAFGIASENQKDIAHIVCHWKHAWASMSVRDKAPIWNTHGHGNYGALYNSCCVADM